MCHSLIYRSSLMLSTYLQSKLIIKNYFLNGFDATHLPSPFLFFHIRDDSILSEGKLIVSLGFILIHGSHRALKDSTQGYVMFTCPSVDVADLS